MTRIGTNPLKLLPASAFPAPAPLSLATITCVPAQTGFWAQALHVMAHCLQTWRATTHVPYELLVFDNGSCPAVVRWLQQEQQAGRIQTLILSHRNLGKVGAWNQLLRCAPGAYVMYADSDVVLLPGWFEASRVLLDVPGVGAVAGCGTPHAVLVPGYEQQGARLVVPSSPWVSTSQPVPEAMLRVYAEMIGVEPEAYVPRFERALVTRLSLREGITAAWMLPSHFQFLTTRGVLNTLLPFDPCRRFGEAERQWEVGLERHRWLGLATEQLYAQHVGNRLSRAQGPRRWPGTQRLGRARLVRRGLWWLQARVEEALRTE